MIFIYLHFLRITFFLVNLFASKTAFADFFDKYQVWPSSPHYRHQYYHHQGHHILFMFLSPWCIVVKRAGATAGEVWRREGARPPSTMQWGKHLILSGLSSIKEVFHFNRNIFVYLRSPSENFVDHPSFNTNKQCIPNLKGIIHLFIQLLTRKAKCDGAMVCWKWCLSKAAAKKLDK